MHTCSHVVNWENLVQKLRNKQIVRWWELGTLVWNLHIYIHTGSMLHHYFLSTNCCEFCCNWDQKFFKGQEIWQHTSRTDRPHLDPHFCNGKGKQSNHSSINYIFVPVLVISTSFPLLNRFFFFCTPELWILLTVGLQNKIVRIFLLHWKINIYILWKLQMGRLWTKFKRSF